MKWILIFYLAGTYAGGPSTAVFDTKAACETAISQIKIAFSRRLAAGEAICVSSGAP